MKFIMIDYKKGHYIYFACAYKNEFSVKYEVSYKYSYIQESHLQQALVDGN